MNFRRSTRWGYDGWALLVDGAQCPLAWSLCRTREECRELLRERTKEGLFSRLAVSARPVKVKIRMEVTE
jgi:hypothetical protein